jgi:hypothetical protein
MTFLRQLVQNTVETLRPTEAIGLLADEALAGQFAWVTISSREWETMLRRWTGGRGARRGNHERRGN